MKHHYTDEVKQNKPWTANKGVTITQHSLVLWVTYFHQTPVSAVKLKIRIFNIRDKANVRALLCLAAVIPADVSQCFSRNGGRKLGGSSKSETTAELSGPVCSATEKGRDGVGFIDYLSQGWEVTPLPTHTSDVPLLLLLLLLLLTPSHCPVITPRCFC